MTDRRVGRNSDLDVPIFFIVYTQCNLHFSSTLRCICTLGCGVLAGFLYESLQQHASSKSLFRPTRLSVHPSVRPSVRLSVRHKNFFSLKSPWNHPLTPEFWGRPPGLTPGTPGALSLSGGARICPRSRHFLVKSIAKK